MTEASVLVSDSGSVRTITINRTDQRNAIDLSVAHGVSDALDELEESSELLIGVLTGAGENFCSGMDLKAFAAGDSPVLEQGGLAGLVTRERSKILIGAVEGWALAGGFELALACDLLTVGRSARFGLPEVKRGLVASSGGLLRLPRRIPPAVALQYALTGEWFDADEAFRLGLTATVVETGMALTAARELAARIVANGPLAVAATRCIITDCGGESMADAFARQAPLADPVIASRDALEGARAFAEKRAAVWAGR
jgi:enoyl-CoA hydratase